MIMLSPGVKTREIDLSTYIAQLSMTVVGMVGTSRKGPLDTPTLITNPQRFLDAFGEPFNESDAPYAALQYLRKGSQLWFVRVAGDSKNKGYVILGDNEGTQTVKLTALTYGDWINGWSATVSDVSGNNFRVTIADSSNNAVEQYDCNLNPASTSYVETVFENSNICEAEDMLSGAGGSKVMEPGIGTFASGHNGISYRQTNVSTKASILIPTTDEDGGTPKDGIKVEYNIAGTDGNHYSAIVTNVVGTRFDLEIRNDTGTPKIINLDNVSDEDGLRVSTIALGSSIPVYYALVENSSELTFDLVLEDATHTPLETYTGCSMDPNSDDYVVDKINGISTLFTVTVLTPNEAMKNIAATELTGGLDYTTLETWTGVSTVHVDSHYIEDYCESQYVTFDYLLSYSTSVVADTYNLAGGAINTPTTLDGVDAADYIGTSMKGLQLFNDTELYDVNLLAVPGVSTASVINEMITICENRQDCLAIVDPPDALTPQGVVDWHNGTGYSHQAFNSSYAALYYPWVEIYDPYSETNRYCPPSGFALEQIAYNDYVGEPWTAPAGFRRGRVTEGLQVAYNTTVGDRDYLYSRENAVNVLKSFPKYGITIWGQRTLQRASTALDRINVRRLLLMIRKAIAISTGYLVFEPNDSFTWNEWKGMVEPYMESIKARRGVYDYRVVMDETTVTAENIDRGEMPGRILLKPTKAAEFIPIDFVLYKTGAAFAEVPA